MLSVTLEFQVQKYEQTYERPLILDLTFKIGIKDETF